MKKEKTMVPVPKLKKLISGTGTEVSNITKAFTLVELIVVITILSILSTIGFVSFSGYLAGTRDINRIAQLKAISDALELYSTKKDLPIPDDKIDIKVGNPTEKIIAYQGYIGKNVLETIEYTESGLDPKDKNYFSYYLTRNKKYFQLLAFLEEPSTDVVAFNNKIQATDYSEGYPKTTGKKLGILTGTGTDLNTPIQEFIGGSLNIETTTGSYIANISTDTQISGTGNILVGLENLSIVGGKIFKSCKSILDDNLETKNKDGLYFINPEGKIGFQVYCDMTTDGGGWTLIMRGSPNDSNHETSEKNGNILNPDDIGKSAKLSDITINNLKDNYSIFRTMSNRGKWFIKTDSIYTSIGYVTNQDTASILSPWNGIIQDPYTNRYGLSIYKDNHGDGTKFRFSTNRIIPKQGWGEHDGTRYYGTAWIR